MPIYFGVMLHNIQLCVRFLYIFVWKRIDVLSEDFFGTFLTIFSFVMSVILSIVSYFTIDHRYAPFYQICLNVHPQDFINNSMQESSDVLSITIKKVQKSVVSLKKADDRFNIWPYFIALGLILHIAMSFLTEIKRKCSSQGGEGGGRPMLLSKILLRKNFQSSAQNVFNIILKKDILSNRWHAILVFLIIIANILVHQYLAILIRTDPICINSVGNKGIAYITITAVSTFFLSISPLLYNIEHPECRRYILNMVKAQILAMKYSLQLSSFATKRLRVLFLAWPPWSLLARPLTW